MCCVRTENDRITVLQKLKKTFGGLIEILFLRLQKVSCTKMTMQPINYSEQFTIH